MTSVVTGKTGEYRVFAELLRHGFDVYQPLADDHGVDCIVKSKTGNRHIDIQIRTSATTDFNIHYIGKDYFYVLYSEMEKKLWIIPSEKFLDFHECDDGKGRWRKSNPSEKKRSEFYKQYEYDLTKDEGPGFDELRKTLNS